MVSSHWVTKDAAILAGTRAPILSCKTCHIYFRCRWKLKTRSVQFFVPSARIYGLSDTIPFHIQLNGPISSLRQFFPPDALQRITSTDSTLSIFSESIRSKDTIIPQIHASKEPQPCVRVMLTRQVLVVRNGDKVWRNSIIGEGTVYPLPPPLIRDACLGTREESLDWKGQIRCNEDAAVGTFVTSMVQVQVCHFICAKFKRLKNRNLNSISCHWLSRRQSLAHRRSYN